MHRGFVRRGFGVAEPCRDYVTWAQAAIPDLLRFTPVVLVRMCHDVGSGCLFHLILNPRLDSECMPRLSELVTKGWESFIAEY